MTERPLTDADLRSAKFGALPDRVRPDDYVELIETGRRRDRPEPAGSREQSQALQDGAG